MRIDAYLINKRFLWELCFANTYIKVNMKLGDEHENE